MHDDVLPAETASLAAGLAGWARKHGLALGGGTACALRLGHRASRDLDFFSLDKLDPPKTLDGLAGLSDVRLRGISAAELAVVVGGIDVSATSLGRGTLGPTDAWRHLDVLCALDLAELKVDAAVRRGMVRDLCDLHLLCMEAGADLEAAVRAGPHDLVVALKALTDSARFAGQPALELRRRWSVGDAVAFFQAAARRMLA